MTTSYPSFQRLLSCLEEIRNQLDNKQDDFMFLNNYFSSQEFQTLFKVHNVVSITESHRKEPVNIGALDLIQEICDYLEEAIDVEDAEELKHLLTSPHLQALLLAHDRVAANDIQTAEKNEPLYNSPEMLQSQIQYGTGVPVKYITLIKSGNDPLGATVVQDPDTGDIMVARILHGGVVDRSGTLQVGDVIQEINGTNLHGKTTDEVVDIMEKLLGSVMFKVIPGTQDKKLHNESNKIRLRALFNYQPSEDELIPCKEAGKAFKQGDILHVVSRDDPNWWQAKEEGIAGASIGLIPSKQFQERRFILDKILIAEKENQNRKDGIRSILPQFKKKRKSAILTRDKREPDTEQDDVLTYEEVVLYTPNNNKQRPILLIGPHGVGRNELKKRLLASDNERFATAVPHTSRRIRPYETDGKEYNFVSRTTMENYDQNNKFIEYGEYRKCLYGTSIDSIKRVLKTGKICIIKVQPQAIKILRQKEYKPYIVYIKPPSLERLKTTRLTVKTKADKKHGQRIFKEDDLQEMIKGGEAIEKEYGHHFDEIIVNDDLQVAYFELNNAIERVTSEALWVPTEWL